MNIHKVLLSNKNDIATLEEGRTYMFIGKNTPFKVGDRLIFLDKNGKDIEYLPVYNIVHRSRDNDTYKNNIYDILSIVPTSIVWKENAKLNWFQKQLLKLI